MYGYRKTIGTTGDFRTGVLIIWDFGFGISDFGTNGRLRELERGNLCELCMIRSELCVQKSRIKTILCRI